MSTPLAPRTTLDWLDGLWALTLRELRWYFSSPIAWIATTVYLLLNGALFARLIEVYTAQANAPVAGSYHLFQYSMFLLTFICPALTMHLLALDRQNGTLEALLTAPVTELQIALSKFLGCFTFYLSMLATLGTYIIVLARFGDWELGPIASSFLGLACIGALFISFGLLASSFTQSQLLAFLVAFLFNLGLVYLVGLLEPLLGDGGLRNVIHSISIQEHFQDFCRGLVKTTPLVFYLSTVTLLLLLTVRSIESRTWR